MKWKVIFHPEFEPEFDDFSENVQSEILARAGVLEEFGPTSGRPNVDTLKESRHTNMKELRFYADQGVWRVFFAFDPERQAILLVAGDKAGKNEKNFYKKLIKKADLRFERHLDQLKRERK